MLQTNKIYLGDCLQIMKDMEDKSIDMILCDLPYNVTQCKWDKMIPLESLWEQYKRIVKENAAIVLFGTEPFSSFLRMSNLEWFRYDMVWEKERCTNIFFVKKQIAKVHEMISVFYKKQPIYNPQMQERNGKHTIGVFGKDKKSKTHKNQIYKYSKDYDITKIYPKSVLKFNRDTLKGALHPTQKPVSLCEFLIKTYTNKNDVVLDNCIGSGTTAIACINTQRHYVGIEKEEKYVEIANERIEKIKHQI